MSKVEVFIASWSGTKKYLAETVASIERQELKPDVFLVDETEQRAMHKWNERIERSVCDYIAFCHADDIYLPTFLSETVAYLDAHPECGAVFTLDYIIDAEGKRVGQTPLRTIKEKDSYTYEDIFHSMLKSGNVLRCETYVARVKTLRDNNIRWGDKCGTANDVVHWFDVLNVGNIGIIPKPLVLYRQHPDSDTQKNVVGKATQGDGIEALVYAAGLRPEVPPWFFPCYMARTKDDIGDTILKSSLDRRMAGHGCSTLFVVHEPPDNAGTGVLVRERVRRCNEGGEGKIGIYICPNKQTDKIEFAFYKGIPVYAVPTEKDFQELVTKISPERIEFHHLWRWPLGILGVETKATKTLYFHDWYLWCPDRLHGLTGDNEICLGPEPEKCAACTDKQLGAVNEWNTKVQLALKNVNEFVAHSDYMASLASRHLGVTVMVDEPAIPPLVRENYKGKVGYFGNFLIVKGVDLLVKAAGRLPEIQFHLWSDLEEESRWMLDGRRLHGMPNVVFHGRYQRRDLSALSLLVDLCVVPSRVESFGLVARELQLLGVPTIATTAGGMESVGSIPPDDLDALVGAIRRHFEH